MSPSTYLGTLLALSYYLGSIVLDLNGINNNVADGSRHLSLARP